ncbi:MAG: septation protein A [Methylococcaceae bacterium]|nr:septation protein A [Methylococcaceae bacterium]MCI0668168.1 septation protein A [Methylococcaceae bacterium]MCI0732676.1 septation protein A [Methylococcaceae bacterium]
MKLLFDFFPILLFFFAYKFFGIFVATGVAISATMGQVAVAWFRTRTIEKMQLVTLAMIIVFGGATLFFKDETFIKWKPTVINWIFGLAFLVSQFVGKRPIVERLMGGSINFPSMIWRRLNMMWALFFIALGGANLFVIYSFDTNTWVNFKLFGMFGLMLLFVFIQAIYLSRHMSPNPETESED